jgi:hypothetical protein
MDLEVIAATTTLQTRFAVVDLVLTKDLTTVIATTDTATLHLEGCLHLKDVDT